MAITVQERAALRALVTWTRAELTDLGSPSNRLAALVALNEQRMAEYQEAIDLDMEEVRDLADSDPGVDAVWEESQEITKASLRAEVSAADIALIVANSDPRVQQMAKQLPLLCSLRRTLVAASATLRPDMRPGRR